MGEEKQQLKTVPIIAMTASAMKSELHACIDAGMNSYILKSLDRGAWFIELQKVLGAK